MSYMVTRGYLLDESLGQRTICGWCVAAVKTINHIIFEYQELKQQRDNIIVAANRKDWNTRHLLADVGHLQLVLE